MSRPAWGAALRGWLHASRWLGASGLGGAVLCWAGLLLLPWLAKLPSAPQSSSVQPHAAAPEPPSLILVAHVHVPASLILPLPSRRVPPVPCGFLVHALSVVGAGLSAAHVPGARQRAARHAVGGCWQGWNSGTGWLISRACMQSLPPLGAAVVQVDMHAVAGCTDTLPALLALPATLDQPALLACLQDAGGDASPRGQLDPRWVRRAEAAAPAGIHAGTVTG